MAVKQEIKMVLDLESLAWAHFPLYLAQRLDANNNHMLGYTSTQTGYEMKAMCKLTFYYVNWSAL